MFISTCSMTYTTSAASFLGHKDIVHTMSQNETKKCNSSLFIFVFINLLQKTRYISAAQWQPKELILDEPFTARDATFAYPSIWTLFVLQATRCTRPLHIFPHIILGLNWINKFYNMLLFLFCIKRRYRESGLFTSFKLVDHA